VPGIEHVWIQHGMLSKVECAGF